MDLSKEARQARNEYMREWRRKNKDKVKKHQEDYWERQASNKQIMNEARKNKTPLNTNELHNEYKDYSLISGIDYILKSQAAKTIKEGGSK
jgi:hypothetical protein